MYMRSCVPKGKQSIFPTSMSQSRPQLLRIPCYHAEKKAVYWLLSTKGTSPTTRASIYILRIHFLRVYFDLLLPVSAHWPSVLLAISRTPVESLEDILLLFTRIVIQRSPSFSWRRINTHKLADVHRAPKYRNSHFGSQPV